MNTIQIEYMRKRRERKREEAREIERERAPQSKCVILAGRPITA